MKQLHTRESILLSHTQACHTVAMFSGLSINQVLSGLEGRTYVHGKKNIVSRHELHNALQTIAVFAGIDYARVAQLLEGEKVADAMQEAA